jgi:hypothetical protein
MTQFRKALPQLNGDFFVPPDLVDGNEKYLEGK